MVIPWFLGGFWVDASWYGLSSLCVWDCSLCFSYSWDRKKWLLMDQILLHWAKMRDVGVYTVFKALVSQLTGDGSASVVTWDLTDFRGVLLKWGPRSRALNYCLLKAAFVSVWHLPGDTWTFPWVENQIVMLVVYMFVLQWPNSCEIQLPQMQTVLGKAHINLTSSVLWAKTEAVRGRCT